MPSSRINYAELWATTAHSLVGLEVRYVTPHLLSAMLRSCSEPPVPLPAPILLSGLVLSQYWWPLTMNPCVLCSGDTDSPPVTTTRPNSSKCLPGDICLIRASISTPIELMLQSLNAVKADPDALGRSQFALAEIKPRGIGKPRPCILSRPAIPGVRAGEIYLVGTLEGKLIDADDLAELLRLFVKPIFPNHGLPGAAHYHTTPAWPHKSQWIVGFPVKVECQDLEGLTPWQFRKGGKYPVDPPDTVYSISRDTLQSFRNHCMDTFNSFQAQCETEPGFAKGREERWRVRVTTIVGLLFGSRSVPMDQNQEATLSKISLVHDNPTPSSAFIADRVQLQSPFTGAAARSTASIASVQSQRVSRPPSLRTVHENDCGGNVRLHYLEYSPRENTP